MKEYAGKSITGKTAVGRVWFYSKEEQTVEPVKTEDTEAELKRFESARVKTMENLADMYKKAVLEAGEASAEIFEIHRMMLEDEDYLEGVRTEIESGHVNAEHAVKVTGDRFSGMFAEMEDEYFQARALDIKDVTGQVIDVLTNRKDREQPENEPVILAAKDLAPSETVRLEKDKLLGFVIEDGSPNSHTAILARTMNIPAVTGIPVCREWDGKIGAIDGEKDTFYIEPDENTLKVLRKKMEKERERENQLRSLKGKETVTRSGKKIRLYANIGSLSDLNEALKQDAEGIGLFRSEFLYLEQDHAPTEEEQFRCYRRAAEMMDGKPVVIRTMDIGADKQVDYLGLGKEENPALGLRAIRICMEQPELLRTQLRAIYRASAYGKLAVMYPMITSAEEVREIKKISAEIRRELIERGIPMGTVEEGIMIETPAAALISDQLAEEVDFFSIGTNDLSQYTMAIDRQNRKLERFFQPHHPAVLRLIEMTVKNGHAHGCWVGICGELGADLKLTETFIKMGVDELSVSAGMILPVRKAVRECD